MTVKPPWLEGLSSQVETGTERSKVNVTDGLSFSPVFLKHKILCSKEEIMKLEENVANGKP